MKTQNYFFVFALFTLLNSLVVSATPSPGHDATSVGPGTFSGSLSDTWSFPGKVGIETTSPSNSLDIGGGKFVATSGGQVYMEASVEDKISLYGNRFGAANMYGFGVEPNALYYRSNALHRWYSGANADGGVSDIMELDSSGRLYISGYVALAGDKALVFGGDSTSTPDTTPQAQLYLGGPDNLAYNIGATKVLIEGYDNEAEMTIMEFRDENDATDFLAKSANGASALPTLYWRGNVGIGTSSPTYPLHVKGQIMGSYTDGSNTWRLERGSDAWLRLYESTGTTYQDFAVGPFWANGATRFDLAEVTPVREEDLLEPGDVVSIDATSTVRMRRSNKSYDTLVAGIISDPKTASMVIGGDTSPEDINTVQDKRPIALVGRVPCKVTTENGPIAVGDLLVTSSTPGHAMKADVDKLKPGMVLGKALEPLNEGEGMIFVWVALQ